MCSSASNAFKCEQTKELAASNRHPFSNRHHTATLIRSYLQSKRFSHSNWPRVRVCVCAYTTATAYICYDIAIRKDPIQAMINGCWKTRRFWWISHKLLNTTRRTNAWPDHISDRRWQEEGEEAEWVRLKMIQTRWQGVGVEATRRGSIRRWLKFGIKART